MRLFVTGGTGFIGSHFLRAAIAAGHDVRALRRNSSVPRVAVPESVEWLTCSMESVAEADIAGCEALVHLAAHSANAPYDSFENCLYWNAVVPARLLEVCRRAGVGRYIIAGTCFEYGRSAERYEYVPTDAPLEPVASYPASKAAATATAIAFARHYRVELSVLRPFQVFGEGEPESRLWPALRRAAASGADFPMSLGSQVRDFIPVSDVAAAFVSELDQRLGAGEPVIRNVGTGRAQTILEFAEQWWAAWGGTGRLLPGTLPLRPSDIMRCVAKI